MAEEVKATQQQPSAPVVADLPAEAPDSMSSKPADDKPADDKPADDKLADDNKPADDKPADDKPADEKPAEPWVTPSGTANGDENVEEAPPVASGALQVDAEQDAVKGDTTVGKGAEAAEDAAGTVKEAKTESHSNVNDHVYDGIPKSSNVGKSDDQASAIDKDVSMSEPASEVPASKPAPTPKPEDTTAGAPEANGVTEPLATEKTPTEAPAAEANGAGAAQVEPAAVSSEAAKGGKRKAEAVEEPATTNGDRAEKKAKTAKTDAVKDKAHGVAASRARPKKDKNTTADAAPVGKTLRKTRSQGPA